MNHKLERHVLVRCTACCVAQRVRESESESESESVSESESK